MCKKRMKRIHLCLDIEGGIINAKELRGCINVDGKTLNTVKEVRDFLKGQLAMGIIGCAELQIGRASCRERV